MARTIGGIVAGIVVFLVTLMALEWLAHRLFGEPGGGQTAGMLAFVAFAYFLSAFLGGAVAARISGEHWAAWVIAILVALGGVYTIATMPQPLWMQVASIVAPLLGGFVASRFAGVPRVRAHADV